MLLGELTMRQDTVKSAGYPVRSSLRHGEPREEIAAAIRESGAELVVLGSRGLNSVSKMLLGSVSEFVVRHSVGDVLIVRKPIVPPALQVKGA